jgi:hypothetical protein
MYSLVTYSPYFVFAGVFLSAITLVIKLLKGPVLDYLDAGVGTRAVFTAINLSKRISVRNNDVPAKVGAAYSRLWSSEKIYKNADGMLWWPLKVRGRLAVSVVFDAYWWLRGVSSNPTCGGALPIRMENTALQDLENHVFDGTELDIFGNNGWFLEMDWGTMLVQ